MQAIVFPWWTDTFYFSHIICVGWTSALWYSFLLWSLPVLRRWSSPLVASIYSVWPSAWLCLGDWWGLLFGSLDRCRYIWNPLWQWHQSHPDPIDKSHFVTVCCFHSRFCTCMINFYSLSFCCFCARANEILWEELSWRKVTILWCWLWWWGLYRPSLILSWLTGESDKACWTNLAYFLL